MNQLKNKSNATVLKCFKLSLYDIFIFYKIEFGIIYLLNINSNGFKYLCIRV